MATHTQLCPPLVGRRDELAALIERRGLAARGRGSLVLIEGEAGVGKSRLVDAFCETLSNGRASLGYGICREFGSAPFGAVAEALRGTDSCRRNPRRRRAPSSSSGCAPISKRPAAAATAC